MKVSEARKNIENAGGNWEIFCNWMHGQTMGIDSITNEPDIYEWDVERFIRYQCNPENEPVLEFD